MVKGAIVMAQSINVNIRMDEDLKKQAEQLFAEFGMNMTTAFTIFVKTVVRERRIPFEIAAAPIDDFFNEYNQARLKKSIDALNAGNGMMHELIEAENE
jgi:DNA-damage-inducible protein J